MCHDVPEVLSMLLKLGPSRIKWIRSTRDSGTVFCSQPASNDPENL